jgi:hypothetical protein
MKINYRIGKRAGDFLKVTEWVTRGKGHWKTGRAMYVYHDTKQESLPAIFDASCPPLDLDALRRAGL